MNSTFIRLRYTQFFIICLLSISLYITAQSMTNGISQYDTNLWGRRFLVTTFTRLRLKLGDHVFSQAVVGKGGWLEFTGFRNLDDYQNATVTTPEELKNTQQKLQEFYEELRKRNITLILVISPNKATIYPDKLPDEIPKINAQSNLDAFVSYMQQYGPPMLVDVRPALREGRKQQDIYYRTDTHWNPYGAFYAYREIMHKLSKSYPLLTPNDIKNYKLTITRSQRYGIAGVMGAAHILEDSLALTLKKSSVKWTICNEDSGVPMTVSTSSEKNSPRLLMYMDSFGLELKNFLAPHFSEATFIHISSQYPGLRTFKTVDANKPNVIIVEIVERSFNNRRLDIFLDHFLAGQK